MGGSGGIGDAGTESLPKLLRLRSKSLEQSQKRGGGAHQEAGWHAGVEANTARIPTQLYVHTSLTHIHTFITGSRTWTWARTRGLARTVSGTALPSHTVHTSPSLPAGNSIMQNLDLGQNGIGDRGAAALAEALRLNTTLQKLDLSGNAIDVEGASESACRGKGEGGGGEEGRGEEERM